jgi:hypothetical protein
MMNSEPPGCAPEQAIYLWVAATKKIGLALAEI